MSKELKTGIIISVIIMIFIWGFNFLKGKNLFSPGARDFFVEYKNINGLNKASIVTINGLKVGHIEDITFNTIAEKKGSLLIHFVVEDGFEFSKKSTAKIYSAGLMGGQNLAVVPSYEGELAVSGDYLEGEVEVGMFDSVGTILDPIQAQLQNVLVGTDSLLIGANQILDRESRLSLNRSIIGLEGTITDVRKTLRSVNGLLASSKSDIQTTLSNTKAITSDFKKFSGDLAEADLGATIKKMEETLAGVNAVMENLKKGDGTLGKLMTDEKMYTNLTNASKEMEELLREMKLLDNSYLNK